MRNCRLLLALTILATSLGVVGCGPASKDEPGKKPAAADRKRPSRPAPSREPKDNAAREARSKEAKRPEPPRPRRRTLADLLKEPVDAPNRWMEDARKVKVDDARAKAAGIRRLDGRRLTLYTDLPSSKMIDELPAVFDRAFPVWCEYFGVDPAKMKDWRLTGFVIRDRQLFRRLGLLPSYLPGFAHAFCLNTDFWVYEKPGDYFIRHESLHEGTHCFMNRAFGSCGPPWYMEGMAELLSTHHWANGRLQMNYLPRTAAETPMLGRIKLVKDEIAAGRALSLKRVLALHPAAYIQNEAYAWSWAAAIFLDRHPRWGDTFRRLREQLLKSNLTGQFVAAVGDDWPVLERQWGAFVADLDYGCDPAGMLVEVKPGKPLGSGGASVEVSAERGWQDSGWKVEKGKTYRLTAKGRYQVGDRPKIWWCEPGGVTIRYHRGRPLGMLLAAVMPEAGGEYVFAEMPEPIPVGLGTTLTPEQSGTLYFKINESASDWGDNRGSLSVEIRPE
jgi:hypothetical protein